MTGRLLKLALTLALLGAAAPVEAVTKYCDDGGLGSWAGAWNPSAPCSPSTATGNAAAGDTVLLQAGSYSNIFYDLGRSGTPNDPVVWADADGVIGDVVITGTNTISAYDHANHTFINLIFWWGGADDQAGIRLWGHGLKFKGCRFNQSIGLIATHSDSALFKDCAFRWLTQCAGIGVGANACSLLSSTIYAKTANDANCTGYGGYPYLLNITSSNFFMQSTRCSVYSTPGATTSINRRAECGIISYGGISNKFYNSRFDYFNIGDPQCGIPGGLGWRDSTWFNRFYADTFVYHGTRSTYMVGGPQIGDGFFKNVRNTFHSCIFYADSLEKAAADSVTNREPFVFRWHDLPMVQDSIAYCTFITGNQNSSGAFNRGGGFFQNVANYSAPGGMTNRRGHIVHNNFINFGITGFSKDGDPAGAAFTLSHAMATGDSLVIRDNIFYTPKLNTDLRLKAAGNTHQSSTAMGLTNADSVDYNLLWKPLGDGRPIWYSSYTKYATGGGTSDSFYIDTGLQEHGIFAAPMFVDSTIVNATKDTFNLALHVTSPALDAASDGTNIGAWQGEGEGDGTPPVVDSVWVDGTQPLTQGNNYAIRWIASDDVAVSHINVTWYDNVNEDGGTVVMGTANDSTHTWNFPRATQEYNITVAAYDATGNGDSLSYSASNGSFVEVENKATPRKVRNLWASTVNWTAVTLRWTSPGGDPLKTTVCKFDTIPLTESGAYNFRTHGTSVTTGTPSDSGALDSLTIGIGAEGPLTPGTRYYFAIRHVDNDVQGWDPPETSIVSIGECRTTRPAVSKGLRSKSTKSYPLMGLQPGPLWETAVGDSWPRTIAGWPVWDSMGVYNAVRDSMQSAMKGYQYMHMSGTLGYGTSRTTTKLGTKSRPPAWGQPDSVFKANAGSTSIVSATPNGNNLWSIVKQWNVADTTGFQPDDPFKWYEYVNWFVRTQDTTGSRRFSGVVYPERLFLWSRLQNTSYTPLVDDTCTYQAWLNGKTSPCYGMTQAGPQRLNILYRDTTTGELAVVEKQAQHQAYRMLVNPRYVADTSMYQIDQWAEDYTALNVEERFVSGGDAPDTSRSGGTAFLGSTQAEFRARWEQANREFQARAYAYATQYRPATAYMSGNQANTDVPFTGDWGVVDNIELDHTGAKGTGGVTGILANFYGRRLSSAPNVEPSLMTIAATMRSDRPQPIRWHAFVIDSCDLSVAPTGYPADRARLYMGMSYMMDDVIPVWSVVGDNNSRALDPATPDRCYWNSNTSLLPYYWDEPFVNVTTGASVGFSAYGTGTGKGWLGAPVDDKPLWGWDRTDADTEMVSGSVGGGAAYAGAIGADTSCATYTGWTGLGSMGAYGGADTVTETRRTGSPNKVFRVRRAAVDHTDFYNVGFRTIKGFRAEPSRRHSLRFWARAESTTYVVPVFRDSVTGGTSGDFSGNMVWVDTTWREYEVQMGRKGSGAQMDTVQIAFYLADTLGTVYFDNIRCWNRPIGYMYRRFANGIVYLNPDSSAAKLVNVATLFGDTATYDYRNISGIVGNASRSQNNGRIFGHGTAATDTIPAGNAKFTIKQANNFWNTIVAGVRTGTSRMDRVLRGRGR